MIEMFREDKPLSPFIEAFHDARFVKQFGIVALIASFLTCGPGVMLGVGLAVLGFGKSRYYRLLGISVAVLGAAGLYFVPLLALSMITLASGIIYKSIRLLRILAHEGKDDPDWHPTRSRVKMGLLTSILAGLLGLIWFIYFLALSLTQSGVRRVA